MRERRGDIPPSKRTIHSINKWVNAVANSKTMGLIMTIKST
jgi:hypothetical protein